MFRPIADGLLITESFSSSFARLRKPGVPRALIRICHLGEKASRT